MNGGVRMGSEGEVRSGGRWAVVRAVLLGAIGLALLVTYLETRQRPKSAEATVEVDRKELVLKDGLLVRNGGSNAFTGLMLESYPDGTLQSRSAVSNGLLEGFSEGWHTNGVLAVRESFVGGRSHGVRTKWDAASNRIAESSIREAKIHGFHREWYTNGQLALDAEMVEGQPHGMVQRWSSAGLLIGQWVLSNGVVVRTITNAADIKALAEKGGRP
jgi:antitoxin component YwqK of YwqJK toxin-antitoxin module